MLPLPMNLKMPGRSNLTLKEKRHGLRIGSIDSPDSFALSRINYIQGDFEIRDHNSPATHKPLPPKPLPTWRVFFILIALMIGLFLSLMDLSIMSTAMYTISLEFNNYSLTIWAALAYILADIGSVIFFTRLSDVFGRKALILTSFTTFSTFSLACGFSHNAEELVIFRTLQGIGGSGLYSLCMITCPEVTPPKFLPIVVAMMGGTVAIAGVCGPLLGGIITGTSTWRWIFWMNGPIGAISIFLVLLAWPGTKNITDVADPAKFKNLDFLGAALMALGSILFVICLQIIGTREYTLSSPFIIIMLAISLVCWIVFFAWECHLGQGKQFTNVVPHIPWRLLTNRIMGTAFLSTICAGFVQFLVIFSMPLRSQVVDLKTPVQSGIALLPIVVAAAIGSSVGGGASAVKNVTFYTLFIGAVLMIVGAGLLTTLPMDGTFSALENLYQILIGLGIGMAVSTVTFMTTMEVDFADHAIAQGVVSQARVFGGSVGIAVSTIVMNNKIESVLSADTKLSLPTGALENLYISPFHIYEYGVAAAADYRLSFIQTFKQDMQLCIWISILAFLFGLCTWSENKPTVKSRTIELDRAKDAYRAQQQGQMTTVSMERTSTVKSPGKEMEEAIRLHRAKATWI